MPSPVFYLGGFVLMAGYLLIVREDRLYRQVVEATSDEPDGIGQSRFFYQLHFFRLRAKLMELTDSAPDRRVRQLSDQLLPCQEQGMAVRVAGMILMAIGAVLSAP